MIAEAQSAGGILPNRLFGQGSGKQGQAVTDAYGRYVDAVVRGNCYHAADLLGTPVTTQAGLSATTPALTLYNPSGSGILMVLYHLHVLVTSSPAAAVGFSLAANAVAAAAPTSTTSATIYNALQPGGTSQGKGQAYRVCTLAAAPVHFWGLGGVTGASSISPAFLDCDVAGKIIIPPGVAVSLQSTTAAAVVASAMWEEISALAA